MNEYIINMGRFAVINKEYKLKSIGIGSCGVVTLYDPKKSISGMGHYLLPQLKTNFDSPQKTALVATDNRQHISTIQLTLNRNEYDFSIVGRDKLLTSYKHIKPHIVFFEIESMDYDGFTLEKLREYDPTANIVVYGKIDESMEPDLFYNDIFVLHIPTTKVLLEKILELHYKKRQLKYGDVLLNLMLDFMTIFGSKLEDIEAKIAGGAHMYKNSKLKEMAPIGKNNVSIAEKILNSKGIKIISKDVGGYLGRTVTLDPSSGILHIRTKLGETTL